MGRLASESSWFGSFATINNTFAFDNADNNGPGVGRGGFNNDNAIANTPTSISGYDGNGNPIGSYRFDPENRMSGYIYGGGVEPITSDGMGQRVSKAGQTFRSMTYFLYDGAHVLAEFNNAGVEQTEYAYGASGLMQSYWPVANQNPTAHYVAYAFDPQGNAVTDFLDTGADGHAMNIALFSAFGSLNLNGNPGANYDTIGQIDAVGYGGQFGNYTDLETGLVLMGARYYSPYYERWITRDPIGYEGGLNLYTYCGNDPVNNIDPSGLQGFGMFNNPETGQYVGPDWKQIRRNVNGMAKEAVNIGWSSVTFPAFIVDPFDLCGFQSKLPDQLLAFSNSDEVFGARTLDIALIAADAASLGAELGAFFRTPCFIAGTPIATAAGSTISIENIHPGDFVMSRDPQTGKTAAKAVIRTFQHVVHDLITVVLADAVTGKVVDSITATPQHPFFVEGKGFVPLSSLGIGTKVVTRAGPNLIVKSLTHENSASGVSVYNFEVADDHTYFVGEADGGTWVHNDCGIYAAELIPGVNGGVSRGRSLTVREALDRLRRGEDVITGSRSVAKRLAKAASGSNRAIGPELHGAPANGFFRHFHPDPRNGAHIFFH